jgi:hypothetical protein
MIPKFCHNEDCGYVCESNPELDVYADYDSFCPACQKADTYKAGDIPMLKSEMPKFKVRHMIAHWWKNHRDSEYS